MTRTISTIAVAAGAFVLLAASPVAAKTRHHHRAAAPLQAEAQAPSQPYMFYPQEVEGGSSGNLPFNNQIRKHTDGLNANGGR